MKRKLSFLLLIFIVGLTLVGCSNFIYGDEDFYSGKKLSAEDLESIKQSFEETTVPHETDVDGNIIVYWTSGGTVYHYSKDCSSLSRSKAIESGSIEDAIDAGKSKACSICGDVEETVDAE